MGKAEGSVAQGLGSDPPAPAARGTPPSSPAVRLARFLMQCRPAFPPSPEQEVGGLQEVFAHPAFVRGSPEARSRIMLASARSKYQREQAYPWDNFFGRDLTPLLAGKTALDLGCFAGGRGVAWYERYGLKFLFGVDVVPSYLESARLFAAERQVRAEFLLGRAEALPFADGRLGAVLAFDVLEHVPDPRQALAECWRVLAPGGRLFVLFPGFWHPIEHHLSCATRWPALHYFFSGETLLRAYHEVLEERGAEADWYKRLSPQLLPWERGNTINGTTCAGFRRLLRAVDQLHECHRRLVPHPEAEFEDPQISARTCLVTRAELVE
jgi:SAM-dependent methyltransferase